MYHEYYFELFSDIEKTEYGSKVAESGYGGWF